MWSDWWERHRDARFRASTLFFERVYGPLLLIVVGVVLLGGLVALVAAVI